MSQGVVVKQADAPNFGQFDLYVGGQFIMRRHNDDAGLTLIANGLEQGLANLGVEGQRASEVDRLINEATSLRKAIETHRDQKVDDRCWLDDQQLYAALGDGNLGDNGLPPKDTFMANCARYYEQRCRDAGWPSYQDLQAKIAELEEKLILTQKKA